jgi:HNH endonuclease
MRRRMRQKRTSKRAQVRGAQRPHKGQYLKGCQCEWCTTYRERAREYGREGARRSELAYQGMQGRCEGCSDPIHANARLCVFCSQPPSRIGYSTCVICAKLFTTKGSRERKTCGRLACQDKYRNARIRWREYLHRSSVSDITPEQELTMRKRTRKCRLCSVYMTSKPHLPNSKHLDHILPISQGGTHTHGNIRIICRDCNLRRPKDGSDFAGQLTLWAQEPGLASRRSGHWNESRGTCKKGLHPWVPENVEHHGKKRRCKACREAYEVREGIRVKHQCKCGAMFLAPGATLMCPACTDAAAHKGAELHASGLNWDQVAAEVGYGSGWGAAYAAKRIGYSPPPGLAAAKAKAKGQPKPPRLCPDCGTPRQAAKSAGKGHGRPPQCQPCTEARAWRAVEMRQGGMTLRAIADQLGFNSITSVTNLMKTVVEVDSRMGRPCIDDLH